MKRVFILLFFTSISWLHAQDSAYLEAAKACYAKHLETGDEVDPFKAYKKVQECLVGAPAPSFKMVNVHGDTIDMEALKGKVVFLNLWFMDCAPCVAEIPAFNKLVKEYKDKDVAFVAFTSDRLKRLQKDFFPKRQFDFEIIPDARKAFYEVFDHRGGFPTTYIIDKKGKIRHISSGGPTGKNATKQTLKKFKPLIKACLKE